jgi:hypothetical protein
MTWLAPALAGIAAAIAIPTLIILYFLKLRRRDVEISTTLLWKKSIQDLQANAPFQKLRRNILLFLQLLILAGALLAIAQPQFMGQSPTGGRHVIIIDRSASMSATDEVNDSGIPISRLDKAKREAGALVDSLPEPGLLSGGAVDTAMVIVFDTQADVRQTFTADKAALKRAIDGIGPVDTPTSMKQAAQLVAANAPRLTFVDDTTGKLYERPAGGVGTIHLYSDGRIGDAESVTFGPEDRVEFHPAGSGTSPNVGITSLRAERDYNDPEKLSIFVGLESTDRAERQVDVELTIDDAQARIETVTLPAAVDATGAAGGSAGLEGVAGPVQPGAGGVVFEMNRGEGGIVTVNLRTTSGAAPDVMAVDNTAWLVVPNAKKMAVAVVTRGNLFIADAMRELPLSRLDIHTPEAFEAMLASGQGGEYDVVVCDGWLPPVSGAPAGGTGGQAASGTADGGTGGEGTGGEAAGEAGPSLPPGRFLILNAVPAPPLGPIDQGIREEVSVMLGWSRDHPALRNLSLDNLYIFKPRLVEVPDGSGVRVLATSDSGPAIVELSNAETRAIVVPFDVAESNWGFDVSWVLFLGAATQYLGEENASGVARMVQPGQTLTDRLPMNIASARIEAPDGSETDLVPAADGTVVFGPVLKSGIYWLSWDGPAGPSDLTIGGRSVRPFTANLLDAPESEIAASAQFRSGSSTVQALAGQGARSPRKLWPWLILAALVIGLLEWFVYNRKVHV